MIDGFGRRLNTGHGISAKSCDIIQYSSGCIRAKHTIVHMEMKCKFHLREK